MNSSNSEGSIEGEFVSGRTMDATLTPHDVPGVVRNAQLQDVSQICDLGVYSVTTSLRGC
jgi:hypothetical protein